jgi:hypothetical protein
MRQPAFGLVTMLVAASLGLFGCDAFGARERPVILAGVGSGSSVGQPVPAGRYGVTWSMATSDDPDAVCWFELSLASPAGEFHQLAHLTATTGGTTGSGSVDLDEPTVVAAQARTTDCGAWSIVLSPLPDRDPPAP